MQTVLITGGARGLGAALSEVFAKNGYNVIINYNNSQKDALELEQYIKNNYHVEVICIKCDVSQEDEVKAMFKVIKDKYIDWISEDIIIHDQNGRYETTCSEQNIKLYAEYNNGVFSFEIATSKGLTQNPIPRNIKEFWVSMPIIRSINSIKFKEISTRG